jgi:hypothetical protein
MANAVCPIRATIIAGAALPALFNASTAGIDLCGIVRHWYRPAGISSGQRLGGRRPTRGAIGVACLERDRSREGAMIRKAMATILAVLAMTSAVTAQAPARFRWQAGQVLTYKVEHATLAVEATPDSTLESRTRLNAIKRWQVLEVDREGAATLQLSLQSLFWESTKPGGDVLRFDSANPDKTTPELRESLGRYLTGNLAVLRVDALGRVVQVKESRYGPASRFEIELPFAGVLPQDVMKEGLTWDRNYQITLEPPQGTGEKYPAIQHYTCKSVAGNAATFTLSTEIKSLPEALADRLPFLDKMPEGEVLFDLGNGRLHRAVLKVDKELKNHMGEKSSYRFQSSYVEQLIANP